MQIIFKKSLIIFATLAGSTALCSITANAEDSTGELAKKLSNPVAALISVPMQGNYDQNIGPNDKGERYTINVQPVIPFALNDNWNIISRTILPLVKQNDVIPGTSQDGVGDITQSIFFSPKAPTASGWIWGAGPAMLLPTASEKYLGGEKWGVGPTAVLLRQANGWTYGGLANHISSVAGESSRADISTTFIQPFLSYTTKTYTTFGLNTESTYDWKTNEWAVPINISAAQLFKVGKQPMQISLGLRYWAETTPTSPEGLGVRLTYTLLFPK